jgi:hypothetical protein
MNLNIKNFNNKFAAYIVYIAFIVFIVFIIFILILILINVFIYLYNSYKPNIDNFAQKCDLISLGIYKKSTISSDNVSITIELQNPWVTDGTCY